MSYLLLFALLAARPHYGGTLRLSFFEPAETYEPSLASTLPERILARSIYETLARLDESGNPVPGLAVSWQAAQGGKHWTFQLRTDVRFHNGSYLNAAAVRASLEKSVASSTSAAAALLRGSPFLCSAPVPARLVCDLSDPQPALPLLLADPTLAIADADGAGTGPFKVAAASWVKGARIKLEAFEAHSRGRPFLDAVEAEFGKEARRQRVDLELKQADVLVTAPTEARFPGEARSLPPVNLLLLYSGSGACGIPAHLDREAMAGLLPPGRAEAAKSLLPGWISGYDFLFPAPSPQGRGITRGTYRLLFDASDPASRLISSRLSLDLRAAGVELRLDGQPRQAFVRSREAGQHDLYLESVRLRLDDPAGPLGALLLRFPGGDIGSQYRLEQAQMQECRMIPLLHWSDAYVLRPGLNQVRFDSQGAIDLSNSWLK